MGEGDLMKISLKEAEVVEIKEIGEGSRVCLDFVDKLEPSEGILVGNTGHGYVLVLAENRTTDTYPGRPFRVNSGAIHHYILKEEDQTAYLAEIRPGDYISVISESGSSRSVAVGRVKVEKRPLIRLVLKVENKELSVTLQVADSVHVRAPDGTEIQAITLKKGDHVMVQVDQPGRHLGKKIEEEINEF